MEELLIALVVMFFALWPLVSVVLGVLRRQRFKRIETRLAQQDERLGLLARAVEELRKGAALDADTKRVPTTPYLATPRPEPVPAPPVTVTPAKPAPPAVAPAAAAPAPKSPPPMKPPRKPVNWESFFGVRGAAWLGAVALVLAGSFFVKYSVERDLISPPLRVAIVLGAGLLALIAAELRLRRRGYGVTANAACGAGIALLYAGVFAAHGLYHLIPLTLAFGLMIATTLVACLLAIRYHAMVVAVLGLLGGFATPVLLSTGVDRPVGFFSYLLLLNLGLVWLSLRQRWHLLAGLAFVTTLVLSVSWAAKFLSPEKMLIACIAFAVLGLLYLVVPSWLRDHEGRGLMRLSVVAGITPFGLALYLTAEPSFAAQYPLLFGMVILVDLALIAVGLRRGQPILPVAGAVATALVLTIWPLAHLNTDNAWGATLFAGATVLALHTGPLVARLVGRQLHAHWPLDAAGLISLIGAYVWALGVVGADLGDPPWLFLLLVMLMLVLGALHAAWGRVAGVAAWLPALLAVLSQIWFFATTLESQTPRNLAIVVAVGVVWSLVSVLTRRSSRRTGELGVLLVAGVGLFALFEMVTTPLAHDPRAYFLALSVWLALALGAVLRSGWDALLPFLVAAGALVSAFWHAIFFGRADFSTAVPYYLGIYAGFTLLPFALRRAVPRFNARVSPWLAASLAGPLMFWPIYDAVPTTLGARFVGLLPLPFAALSLVALMAVRRIFAAPADEKVARQRLRVLALFAALALGFITLAIPLQLDRQWITLGWALEGAAVLWLFGRLPHPGLKYFGVALFTAVAARLLLNSEVLAYAPRGLPILNWILYTYGVSAAACFAGAKLLGQVELTRRETWEGKLYPLKSFSYAALVAFFGFLLVFALINLEIVDYYSPGPYLAWSWERLAARDLTMSLAWGVYALLLLALGIGVKRPSLRYASLAVLLLTIGKVFLYDLSKLEGLHRVLSFLGLALALIIVSLGYQRFVFKRGDDQP